MQAMEPRFSTEHPKGTKMPSPTEKALLSHAPNTRHAIEEAIKDHETQRFALSQGLSNLSLGLKRISTEGTSNRRDHRHESARVLSHVLTWPATFP